MNFFDYLFVLFIIYMVLEFVTCMLALSMVDVAQLPQGGSILKLAVSFRKICMKDIEPPIKNSSLSALIFFNHLRRLLGFLFLVFFGFLIVMLFVTALS